MEGKLDKLLEKFGNFEEKLDSNMAAVKELKSEVQQLKEGNSDILNSVDGMEGKVGEISEDMNELKERMRKVESGNAALENRIKELETIAETELVRNECLVNKFLEEKMGEVLEKCKEATLEVRSEISTEDGDEAVSVVERVKRVEEELRGTVTSLR